MKNRLVKFVRLQCIYVVNFVKLQCTLTHSQKLDTLQTMMQLDVQRLKTLEGHEDEVNSVAERQAAGLGVSGRDDQDLGPGERRVRSYAQGIAVMCSRWRGTARCWPRGPLTA